MTRLIIHTDGGARGNPGHAAIGGTIKNDVGNHLFSFSKYIGKTTNNVAEYKAVVEALRWIRDNRKQVTENSKQITDNRQQKTDNRNLSTLLGMTILIYLDSTLVVNQINGQFKIKQEHLRDLYHTVKEFEKEIGIPIEYFVLRREENAEADRLVNEALDRQIISNLKTQISNPNLKSKNSQKDFSF